MSHGPALQNTRTVTGVVNKVGATQSVPVQCGAPPAVSHGSTTVLSKELTDELETGCETTNGSTQLIVSCGQARSATFAPRATRWTSVGKCSRHGARDKHSVRARVHFGWCLFRRDGFLCARIMWFAACTVFVMGVVGFFRWRRVLLAPFPYFVSKSPIHSELKLYVVSFGCSGAEGNADKAVGGTRAPHTVLDLAPRPAVRCRHPQLCLRNKTSTRFHAVCSALT